MACDEGILPLDERVADAADEAEFDEIYETERRLLYVACTRAREHLLLTGVIPTSEPDPKVFEQYQPVVIHPSLRRDGVNGGMDWYCPT
jgi:ATP-dependent exoDNAse (exonuclease V) beta subunit